MENFVYSNSLAAKTMQSFACENVMRWCVAALVLACTSHRALRRTCVCSHTTHCRIVVILIGFLTALFALAIDIGVRSISEYKFKLTRNIISKWFVV